MLFLLSYNIIHYSSMLFALDSRRYMCLFKAIYIQQSNASNALLSSCSHVHTYIYIYALKQAYKKHKDLFDKILSETNRLTSCLPSNVNAAAAKRDLFSSYYADIQTSFNRKNNKLAKLVSHSRYLSFENVSLKAANMKLVSMNTEHQRTTLSNVINLSNRNITKAEETLLIRGISFCPSSKLDEVK